MLLAMLILISRLDFSEVVSGRMCCLNVLFRQENVSLVFRLDSVCVTF